MEKFDVKIYSIDPDMWKRVPTKVADSPAFHSPNYYDWETASQFEHDWLSRILRILGVGADRPYIIFIFKKGRNLIREITGSGPLTLDDLIYLGK